MRAAVYLWLVSLGWAQTPPTLGPGLVTVTSSTGLDLGYVLHWTTPPATWPPAINDRPQADGELALAPDGSWLYVATRTAANGLFWSRISLNGAAPIPAPKPRVDVFKTVAASYTLSAVPSAGLPVMVFIYGQLVMPTDYTVAGAVVTYTGRPFGIPGGSAPIQIQYWVAN